jgi:hypothetical protein
MFVEETKGSLYYPRHQAASGFDTRPTMNLNLADRYRSSMMRHRLL